MTGPAGPNTAKKDILPVTGWQPHRNGMMVHRSNDGGFAAVFPSRLGGWWASTCQIGCQWTRHETLASAQYYALHGPRVKFVAADKKGKRSSKSTMGERIKNDIAREIAQAEVTA